MLIPWKLVNTNTRTKLHSEWWLERAREDVRANYGQTLRIQELAASAGVHAVHLSREFQRHYTTGAVWDSTFADSAFKQLARNSLIPMLPLLTSHWMWVFRIRHTSTGRLVWRPECLQASIAPGTEVNFRHNCCFCERRVRPVQPTLMSNCQTRPYARQLCLAKSAERVYP
jgi:hypothetical protein